MAKTMSRETVERVLSVADIVDVTEAVTGQPLRRRGRDWECLCPFHADRHVGSFKVSQRTGRYRCWACGAEGDAIDMVKGVAGLPFVEAVAWLAQRYGVAIDDGVASAPRVLTKRAPQRAELPLLELPMDYVRARMAGAADDTLCAWLRSLPWTEEGPRQRVDVMLRNYYVGRSKDGMTIFWQRDAAGRVRTGKLMKYRPDGHRDKEARPSFGWIHSRMERAGLVDLDRVEMRQCLFGEHLLGACPGATVHIVESEKTALLMAIYYGGMTEHVWMACGGLHNLTRRMLAPLMEARRSVVLHPDHDGIEAWRARRKEIGYKHLTVDASHVLPPVWHPQDGDKADAGDVLVRRLDEARRLRGFQTAEDVIAEFPNAEALIRALGLEYVATVPNMPTPAAARRPRKEGQR